MKLTRDEKANIETMVDGTLKRLRKAVLECLVEDVEFNLQKITKEEIEWRTVSCIKVCSASLDNRELITKK